MSRAKLIPGCDDACSHPHFAGEIKPSRMHRLEPHCSLLKVGTSMGEGASQQKSRRRLLRLRAAVSWHDLRGMAKHCFMVGDAITQ